MKVETARLPLFRTSVYNVWLRNFRLFKKYWFRQVFWMAWEPIAVPLMFAYGIGFFVSNIKGFSYIDFFLASLISISAMVVAFSETALSTFSRLNVHKTYSTIILAPVMPDQILWGEILWATSKGGLAAFAILFVSSLLGMFTWGFLSAFAIALILAFIFATLGVILATYLKSYEEMKYAVSGVVVPLALLCDTYFPLDQLPRFFKYFAYLFPLTHAVSAIRDCVIGEIVGPKIAYHVIFLLIVAGLLMRWAKKRFSAKIIH